MHPVVAVVAIVIIPLVENAQKSEIICTHYKKRFLSAASHSGSLNKEFTPDLLTCSLRCQGDHNCCSFYYNVSSSTCVLQGDVLPRGPSHKCNGSGVLYVEKTKGDNKTCLEGHSGTREAQTKPTIHQQEPTTDISQTGASTSFKHIESMTLHQACEEGRLDEVKYILSTGLENINCRDKKGFTPVIAAALKGQEAVFDFLVRRGCDLSLVTNISNNVLHAACDGGNADIVRKLIDEQKFDKECRGFIGWTPVMFAACFGNRGVVDLLVHKGCNVRVVDDRNDNLLHVACLGGSVDVVKYIIMRDIISIESRGNHGRTPVLTAAVQGHVEVVTLLVSNGCDVRATDDWKRNILYTACLGGHVDMVKQILDKNIVGIDSKDAEGLTPLLIAVKVGLIKAVDLLELKGCNLRAVSADGNNILHTACDGGHVDMVQHIFEQGIFGIESRGVYGRTPVLIAAGHGHIGVVDFLRSKGCNMRVVDKYKNNILHTACLGGHVDMIKRIIKLNVVGIDSRGYNGQTAVMMAVEHGKKEVVDLLVLKRCSLTVVNDNKNTILHMASYGGHVDMVKYVISKHIVSINVRGSQSCSPVMTAAWMGHVEVVDLLKKEGCDMKTVDDAGNNILHVACIGGHVNMVRYLLRLDIVSREKINKDRMTPIQIARAHRHRKVVDLLNAEK